MVKVALIVIVNGRFVNTNSTSSGALIGYLPPAPTMPLCTLG